VPVTKLGRLVKDGKIKSLEQIYLFSLPIKEHQIVEFFLGSALKDEVMKIMPVQKQTRAGQRTRFKAFVVVGDSNGHVGLGVKCSKEVATAIRGAIIMAKLSVIPVRRGYWGNKIGKPHTVPCKVTGKCGSVTVRLVPAPRGSGIVAARVPKKVLQFAGIEDVFTSSRGSTKTLGNFVKVNAMSFVVVVVVVFFPFFSLAFCCSNPNSNKIGFFFLLQNSSRKTCGN
jgi:small subunit ribosomal protein S2e